MKAINIIWDVDCKEDLEKLPKEIDIPEWIDKADADAISDYLSNVTGFCHKGYVLDTEQPEHIWITVYKDVLGCFDEEDNLAEILVPTQWLKDALKVKGQGPYERWRDEYTADNTEGIAVKALNDRVIRGCSGIDLLMDGAKVEWQHGLYEVVGIYDGLVHVQHVNSDAHVEVAIERFVKDAELVTEDQISRSSLDVQIAVAAAKGDAKKDVAVVSERDFVRD